MKNQKAQNLATLMKVVACEILPMIPDGCKFDINIYTDTESVVIFLFDRPYSIVLSNQVQIRERSAKKYETLDYADPKLFDKIKRRCFK